MFSFASVVSWAMRLLILESCILAGYFFSRYFAYEESKKGVFWNVIPAHLIQRWFLGDSHILHHFTEWSKLSSQYFIMWWRLVYFILNYIQCWEQIHILLRVLISRKVLSLGGDGFVEVCYIYFLGLWEGFFTVTRSFSC